MHGSYWLLTAILFMQTPACFSGQNGRFESDTVKSAVRENGMFQVGEELEYSVHYSIFNIGTIKFRVLNREQKNGRIIYHACALMDSNPSLSWLVDLHVRFYGEIDQNVFSHGWITEDSSDKKMSYRKMKFDYNDHNMYFEWGEKERSGNEKVEGKDTVSITQNCQDGLSLFYYAREHARQKMQVNIPTFIDTNEVRTRISFNVENSEEEIDAVDYPIDVVKLEGNADFVGVFGLTGAFEGLFSNDAAGIPITAKLKVILGSVKVELKKWKRDNWEPPHYVEQD
jgi:hypothetical protein